MVTKPAKTIKSYKKQYSTPDHDAPWAFACFCGGVLHGCTQTLIHKHQVQVH